LSSCKWSTCFFNKQLRYVEDIDLWHEVDYWATPVQSLIKAPAIARTTPSPSISACAHGHSREKLRITYVKALRQNRAHGPDLLFKPTGPAAGARQPDGRDQAGQPAYRPVAGVRFQWRGLWLTGARQQEGRRYQAPVALAGFAEENAGRRVPAEPVY
jgi:hypothetical protein